MGDKLISDCTPFKMGCDQQLSWKQKKENKND